MPRAAIALFFAAAAGADRLRSNARGFPGVEVVRWNDALLSRW